MMGAGGWDGQDHHMAAPSDDEFNQFLDISNIGHMADDMHFAFSGFQDGSAQAMMGRPREAADAIMADGDGSSGPMMPHAAGMMPHQPAPMQPGDRGHGHHVPPVSSQMMPTSAPATDPISSIDAQIQYLQQQKFQQQQRQLQERAVFFSTQQNHSVPPTPQSLEMPPGSGHFYRHDQMPQEAYDRGYQQRMKEQHDMSFTPLVSPAVTPLEPHFHMDNAFTVPGAYFSPLTSPALHPQNDTASAYDPSTHSNNSPVDIELESSVAPPPPAVDLSKKARKNNAAKSRSKPSVKSSPISKPQRRKAGPSPAIVSQVLSEVEERANGLPDKTMLPIPATSAETSDEFASVSPENLTDMPPPPVPARRSTSKSPYILAQTGGVSSASTTPTPAISDPAMPISNMTPKPRDEHAQRSPANPATPASLMKLPASSSKKHSAGSQEQTATEHIESLVLPESVSKQKFTPIDTAAASREPMRSESNSAKTATFQSLPSPMASKRPGTASAGQSPIIQPGSGGPSTRKTPQLASRGSRKRSGSVQVSPALLPRISPSIKPLLPGTPGMSGDDATSRLLTSKSNYQNILEGNTVPGLHYPTDLSANLTSKRTSHKIAEQGRRNRINSALHVMAGLLPDQQKIGSGDGDDSDKKDGKQSSAANSKASIVENAIVHMKNLEQENNGLKREIEELRTQLEKMKEPA